MEKAFWKSKKFWVSIGALIGVIVKAVATSDYSQLGVEIAGIGAAYVLGQGFADFGKNGKPKIDATPLVPLVGELAGKGMQVRDGESR